MTTTLRQSRRIGRRAPTLPAASLPVTVILLTGLLAGCHDRLDNRHAVALGDPEKRHAVQFSQRTETLLVEVPRGPDGLSQHQRTDVYRFVDRYKAQSTGPLRLSGPSRIRDHLASSRALQDVEEIIRQAGVPDRAVSAQRHSPGPAEAQTVLRLAFERPVTVAPTCGEWPEDLGQDRDRIHFQNFGCATQRNLALMTDNPRDLIGPQPEDPRLGERRWATWRDYTGADKSGEAAGEAAKPPEAAKAQSTN